MKIAIVGSGISGLASAWLLARDHQVTLFEADARLGGHAHTVALTLDGVSAGVDTGFLVHNDRTYPNLIALFDVLDIPVATSDMSFSVRIEDPAIEWCGTDLNAVFAQRGNLVRPAFWRMLADILRFNRAAPRLLAETRAHPLTLGELLTREGYGQTFRDTYLLPMGAAIWSTPTREMLAFPAHTFLAFCSNHGLLQITDRPQWKTVVGGARTYVERIAADLPDVRTRTPVRAVWRTNGHVRVATDKADETFDHIVLACHSDQAQRLLADIEPQEQGLLAAVRYQPNRAVLHTDHSFLPRRSRAWAAWNYQAGSGDPTNHPVSITYLLNRLQSLPFRQPVMVTLNPHREPNPQRVHGDMSYAHPLLDHAALHAQQQLPHIQGQRNTWFAGAWTGYGFHEDGLRSALSVANGLGVQAPWQPAQAYAA